MFRPHFNTPAGGVLLFLDFLSRKPPKVLEKRANLMIMNSIGPIERGADWQVAGDKEIPEMVKKTKVIGLHKENKINIH